MSVKLPTALWTVPPDQLRSLQAPLEPAQHLLKFDQIQSPARRKYLQTNFFPQLWNTLPASTAQAHTGIIQFQAKA